MRRSDAITMRLLASARAFRGTLPAWLFIEALEIAGAVAFGRYCGVRIATALRSYPAHRPSVQATLRIVRFLIAYIAILTMLWSLEFSNLSPVHQIAFVILAGCVAGAVLDHRGPIVIAVCSRCGKPMKRLAETPDRVVFGCTCGTTVSASQ